MTEIKREKIASTRLKMILPLLDDKLEKADHNRLCESIGNVNGVSIRTLKRWLKLYQDLDYEGLKPKVQDRNTKDAISDEVLDAAIALRCENYKRSVKDIIYVLEEEGICKKNQIKRATLDDKLRKLGFSKKQMLIYAGKGVAAPRRYEKKHRMELVQADFKYGPSLPIGKDGAMVQTYVQTFIDDSSRFILDSKFYARQTVNEVEDSMKRMLHRYGKPKKLLFDNGSAYRSKQLEDTCTKLGIDVIFSAPYSPTTKAKVEVYNNIINKFLSEASLEKFNTLELLNENYKVWVEEYYHEIKRPECKRGNIRSSFVYDKQQLEFLPLEKINNAFQKRITRKVTPTNTISIEGKTYALDNLNLIGFDVEVIYDSALVETKGALVRRIGFEDAHAKLQVITENVDFSINKKPNTKNPIIITDESRILEAQRQSYAKKHPEWNINDAKGIPSKKDTQENLYSTRKEVEDEE